MPYINDLKYMKKISSCILQFKELNLLFYNELEHQDMNITKLTTTHRDCNIELLNMFIRKNNYEFNKFKSNLINPVYMCCEIISSNIDDKKKWNSMINDVKTCDDINNLYI